MTCAACGTLCPAGARHCPGCGMRLGGSAAAGVAVAIQAAPAPSTASAPIVSGVLLNGRYRVERVLGAGAFGRVYLAADTQDPHGTQVALKELLDTQFSAPDDKREAIAWFKREVSTLLTLEHPRIPQIYGYWTALTTAGPFYLSMEYIPGKTLEGALDDAGGRIAWRDAVTWALELCDVLAYLHSRTPPFVFRDMKLPNVMLDSRTSRPVLIDFGITRQLAPSGGTAIGTWGYVPYEQALGRAEPRSDLYALGAVLHALLSGRRPDSEYTRLLRGGVDVETAMKSLFPPLDTLVPDVPEAVARCVARATAFAADDRFADAAQMAAALAAALGGLPTGATPYLGSSLPVAGAAPVTPPPPAVPAAPPSDTIVVSKLGRGQCATIGEAILNARPGMRVEVQPGVYRESLLLDRQIEIVGNGRVEDIVVEGVDGPCLTVLAGDARISGLTLNGRAAVAGRESFALDISGGAPAIHDCHVRSDSLACIAIHGAGANPSLRNCRVADGKHAGIVVYDSALASIDRCEIAGNQGAGIEIRHGANPVVSRCTIRDGQDVGVFVFDYGQGVFEDCDIYGNALMGVAIKEGSTPLLRRCKVRNGRHAGILVYDDGLGSVQNCEITGNANAGVGITRGGNPVIWHCMIHKGKSSGIVVDDGGQGTVEGCEIFGNAAAGVEINDNTAPMIRQCRITQNGAVGVHVHDRGGGTVENCDLAGNSLGAWEKPFWCRVRRSGNRE